MLFVSFSYFRPQPIFLRVDEIDTRARLAATTRHNEDVEMNDLTARLRVSLTEGSFEVEGSEDFVKEQSEVYKELIKKSLKQAPAAPPPANQHGTKPQTNVDSGNVVHVEGGTVRVLVSLPGGSQRAKTVNAGLLALYAMGEDAEIPFDVVRNICIEHSCLNRGNFARYLKGEKKYFLTGGSGKSQTLRLTQPGRSAAAKIMADLAAKAAE